MRLLDFGEVSQAAVWIVAATVATVDASTSAPTPGTASPLGEATRLFHETEFESALQILSTFLTESKGSQSELIQGHVLAARCHVRLDDEGSAIKSVCQVFALNPAWQPDAIALSSKELRACRIALATCPRASPPPVHPARENLQSATRASPRWHERWGWRLGLGAGAAALGYLVWSSVGGDADSPDPDDGSVPGFPPPPTSSRF
jgi:hypothetical protein